MSRCSAVNERAYIGVLKPFGAVAATMAIAALLCFFGLTNLSQEAFGAYRPGSYPLGGGRGFGPGRGPIPYGTGRGFGPGMQAHGFGGHGMGGLGGGGRGQAGFFPGGGPGPVMMGGAGRRPGGPGPVMMGGAGGRPGMGPVGGGLGHRPVDFNSASHWSNFGPAHQYPSVPMGNLHGNLPGAAPGAEGPSSELSSGEASTGEAGESDESSNNLFNYMTQDEQGLSHQSPSSNTWFENTGEGSTTSEESAVAEGMGIEDEHSGEIEDDRKHAENNAGESNGFLAQRDDSKREHAEKVANRQEALEARNEQARKDELAKKQIKNKVAKNDEEKEEDEKKEHPKKELAKKEHTQKESAKKEDSEKEDSENENGKKENGKKEHGEKELWEEEKGEENEKAKANGSHKMRSHKKESHEEESHREESHEEEHSAV